LVLENDEYIKQPGYCLLENVGVADVEHNKGRQWGVGYELLYRYCVLMDFKESKIGFGSVKNI
jgi:hypothetical protein